MNKHETTDIVNPPACHTDIVIAAACHQVNRAWCEAHGDHTQLHWQDAPKWQKTSTIEGVRKALLGNTPEQLHQSWLDTKTREGWVYGQSKDVELKTHPCMVPYEELPPMQKEKDHLFVTTVQQVGAALGVIPPQARVELNSGASRE